MYRLLLTGCCILFSWTLVAQEEDSMLIRKIADDILLNGKAYENLYKLTKTVGGRLSGSPQMYKAEQWGKKTLQEAGADKVYLQECNVPHWVRGGKDEAKFISGDNKSVSLDVLA